MVKTKQKQKKHRTKDCTALTGTCAGPVEQFLIARCDEKCRWGELHHRLKCLHIPHRYRIQSSLAAGVTLTMTPTVTPRWCHRFSCGMGVTTALQQCYRFSSGGGGQQRHHNNVTDPGWVFVGVAATPQQCVTDPGLRLEEQ